MKIFEKYIDDCYPELITKFENEFYCFRHDNYRSNQSCIDIFCCDTEFKDCDGNDVGPIDAVGVIFRYNNGHIIVQLVEEVTQNLTNKIIQFLKDSRVAE